MRFRLAVVVCVLFILAIAGGGSAQSLSSLLSKSQFETMLKHRNNAACPARGFYTYEAFIQAARSFGAFGNTGDTNTRKREIAAFFGQTSHETTGGWASAPDGPYAWGYCHKEERGTSARYRGRGPIQLTHDYNYGQAGRAIGVDLRNNPDLVAKDPVVSFKTALWFWMTPQAPKPSAHDVITGRWRQSRDDFGGRRAAGYGVITNIINGGIECGKGNISPQQQDRIGFYRRYCSFLGVSPGDNLDCAQQRPFGR